MVGGKSRVIAVDGPAGSGKTTVCAEVAKVLGLAFLSSGAIYRAVAWVFLNIYHGRDLEEFIGRLPSLPLEFGFSEGYFRVRYGKDPIEKDFHKPEVSKVSSFLAKFAEIREFANRIQRSLATEKPLIVEGRDTTTVVFPDACLKIFLTAGPEERARRRWKELLSKGIDISFDEVLGSIIDRDRTDSERELAPLSRDPDAVVIDSTGMSIEEVVGLICRLYSERCSF